MQSENFDNEIRNSLSQRPPGNEKPEWDKMETLLNKHMPVEKKDRRRVIFILFLFLLLGGGAFFIWKSNGNNDHDITVNKPTENSTSNSNTSNPTNSTEKTDNKISTNTTELPQNISSETSLSPKDKKPSSKDHTKIPLTNTSSPLPGQEIEIKVSEKNISKNKIQNKIPQSKKATVKNRKSEKQLGNEVVNNTNGDKPLIDRPGNTITPVEIKSDKEKNKEIETIKPIEDNTKADQKAVENKPEEQQKQEESQPKLTATTKTQKQKNGSSFLSNLFFSVSAGPDLSIVKLDYVGKVKLAYGAGIGYSFSKNFTVQTGFYVGRKIYSANPEDYYIPDQFVYYYPKLKPIEADCKIYEVPLNVTYHFNPGKKQSWFVSAGSSSLFMKKEKYNYYYKSRYTYRDTSSTRILENQNQHYFSTLNISGGYERKINEHLTLQAEPYMKFALNGIGSGKVKLNSGGIFLTAVIKPFARRSTIKNSP